MTNPAKSCILSILALCLLGLLAVSPAYSEGDPVDSKTVDEIQMIVGELEQIKVYSLTRLSMTDPSVADIIDADDEEVLIVAKAAGQSALFIWDAHGKRTIMIHVYYQNLETLKSRVKKLLKEAEIYAVNIDVNEKEGKLVLSGEIPEEKEDQFNDIIDPFSLEVINLVELEKNEDLVQIDLQIAELNTTLSKTLGIDWSAGDSNDLVLDYEETLPNLDGNVEDFFKIGDFRRTTALLAKVNALLQEGKGRILSQPKLVVKSGEEASFLVGGEIPIRTTTATTSGATQENVEFKEYGIGMIITPIVKRDKIDVTLNMEISDIDPANAVGDDVAFVTRTAQTRLFLDDGQTIVLAGLIRESESQTVKKVPFLGNIPVIGLVFRSRSISTPNQNTELVISLTPHRISTSTKNKFADEESSGERFMAPATQRFMSKSKYARTALPYYEGIPREMTEYVRSVQQRISLAIVYPQEAKSYGWEGTVKVGLHILSDGTLAYAMVKESSGHEIFDDVAVDTAKRIAPYSKFPAETDLQELNVTIPIVYSLTRK